METLLRFYKSPLCALLLSAPILVSSVFAAGVNDEQRQRIAPSYHGLQEQAESRGKVRVLAQVRQDFVSTSAQRMSLAHDRASRFAQRHNKRPLRVLRRQALQAYDLTRQELDLFIDSAEFTSIVEDKLNAPSLQQSIPGIGADTAHAAGITGNGVAIAVLDTGVEATHVNFGGRVVEEACFSSNYANHSATTLCPNGLETQYGPGAAEPCDDLCSHGTHVASIAAGGDNVVTGVAPDADIIAIQVFSLFEDPDLCDPDPDCVLAYDSDTLAALQHVLSLTQTHTVASVNLSLGGGYYDSACDGSFFKGTMDALRAAGVATVAAAGNEGYTDAMGSPACVSTAISVGSVSDTNDNVHGFSNSASFLDFMAPGGATTAAYTGGGYATLYGTSMATPHVAGAFALVRSEMPGMTVSDIKGLLTSEAVTVVDGRNGLSFPRLDITGVTTILSAPVGSPPNIGITSPANASVIAAGTGSVVLAANAVDAEDGDLGSQISWSSSLQGAIESPAVLSVGTHTLTAAVTDSDGRQSEDSVVVTVANQPQVEILQPASSMTVLTSDTLALSGSASDVEDGQLSNQITWVSSLDDELGQGSAVTATLSPGVHLLVATVTDTDGHGPAPIPYVWITVLVDSDGDKVPDESDNCPNVVNPGQGDFDDDGIGDYCDNSPGC